MKYLKRIEDSQLETELFYTARRPCVMMTDSSQDDDVTNFDKGVTLSGSIIYKGGGTQLTFMNFYGRAYANFNTTINGVDFAITDENFKYYVPSPFDGLKISTDFYTDEYALLFAMFDLASQNVISIPQAYYDYLAKNNLTESDIKTQLSSSDTEAVNTLQLDMLANGFYCDIASNNSVRVFFRSDVESFFPEANDGALGYWVLPFGYYDKKTNKIIMEV